MMLDVFYVTEGERYYLSPQRCAADNPGAFVRTCSPQRARRLGLAWDAVDKAAYQTLQRERRSERLEIYRHDPETGQRFRRDGQ